MLTAKLFKESFSGIRERLKWKSTNTNMIGERLGKESKIVAEETSLETIELSNRGRSALFNLKDTYVIRFYKPFMLLMSHLIEKGISTNIFVFYSCLITWYFSFESNRVCLYKTSWRIKHIIVLDPDMFLFMELKVWKAHLYFIMEQYRKFLSLGNITEVYISALGRWFRKNINIYQTPCDIISRAITNIILNPHEIIIRF